MTTPPDPELTARVRAFNRFYTRLIGVLDEAMLRSDFTLGEARLLFELHAHGPVQASELARELSMDPAQISRMVARLRQKHVLDAAAADGDKRARTLMLTEKGRSEAETLNARSSAMVDALLARIDPDGRQALADALAHARALLEADTRPEPDAIALRNHRIGELGWLIHRQGRLYHAEYGWNGEFEALIARIYADFENAPDAPPKQLWVADLNGAVAGSVFVIPNAEDPAVAQLRLLYVEPFARGLGLGHRLVGEAVGFAKRSGYRAIMLWTQDCLTAARRIYERAGFRLEREDPHHSFGVDLNGQYLRLDF